MTINPDSPAWSFTQVNDDSGVPVLQLVPHPDGFHLWFIGEWDPDSVPYHYNIIESEDRRHPIILMRKEH